MSLFARYIPAALGGGGGGSAGITSINSDGTAAQTLTVGTSGTNFAIIDDGIGGHVFNLPTASASNRGALSSADWSTFNAKQAALTIGDLTAAGTDGIVVTGGAGSIIGSGTSLAQHVADASHNGYLSSTDWSTFNAKQPAGSYALTTLSNLGTTAINADLTFGVTPGNIKGFGASSGGTLVLSGGAGSAAAGGTSTLQSGANGFGNGTTGGAVSATSGSATNGGGVTLTGGVGVSNGGPINITGGSGGAGTGGAVNITAGSGGVGGTIALSGTTQLTSLAASLPLQLGASKNIISQAIDLSGTQATGILAAARFPALTGDITTASGALATTLATVNPNVGSFTNASITVNAKGLITAASNGTAGTVTSVTFTGDGTVLSSTPSSAVTTSGTVTASLNTQSAGTFLAGPTSGSAAAPTFRALQPPTNQTLLSGSAATYTTPAGVLWIKVRAVGGGGGGGNSGAGASGSGTTGGNTTFGTSLLTANGGVGGAATTNSAGATGGVGGTATVTTSGTTLKLAALQGGQGGSTAGVSVGAGSGGAGASTPFGGAPAGGLDSSNGASAIANTGSGGTGAGGGNTLAGAGGGGAGGYLEAIIYPTVAQTFTYTVGAGGVASGGGGFAGGSGGSGIIVVEEYYQ